MRKKPIFCWKCGEVTPHVHVGKESAYEGHGLVRGFMAVASLGMTETAWACNYWQCEACGHIKKQS